MSAGLDLPTPGLVVVSSLDGLAPQFRAAVEAALEDCARAKLDAFVYESLRSHALALEYYARGRTERPPDAPVTNATDETWSWHGYGLAVDVISRAERWGRPPTWFAQVAGIFKVHGCDWGGDWSTPDYPHMQWGTLRATPSDRARQLLASGGLGAVWEEVDAA